MSITQDDVRRILSLVESSAFDELKLEMGDFKLAVSKQGPISGIAAAPATAAAEPSPVPDPSTEPTPTAAASATAPKPPPPAAGEDADSGLIEITSPIVGIFYTAPEPGAAAFVEEGSEVSPDDTVGIVEVMKVFNSVPAGVTGTIAKRVVENNAFVEFGQPLYLVRPKSS